VPHRIEKDEEIGAALLRLAGDDLAAARRDLNGAGAREQRVHRVRQRLKRVRTLLRVIEPGLGERAAEARESLNAVARMLAGARDADVAAASARGLAAATPRAAELGLDRVVEALDREAALAHHEKTPIGEVGRRLGRLIADVAALGTEPFDGGKLLEDALERVYRQGRKSMERAHSSLATPDLHRWRKKVKDLWHLLRLARKRLSQKGRKAAPLLERLGDLLGLDHDHAMLAEKLALSPTGDPALMSQLSLIADKRRELEAEAFELGERIYGEPTRAFARTLHMR
jgi:CHAD domain-containing protein